MNVNIFCPIFFCCLEHDNSKSPSDFIVIHRIKVNMTFPRPCLIRRRSAQTGRPRPPGCALRSRKTNKMSVFAENRWGIAMVISTLVETGPGWPRVELNCSNSRGMSQIAAAGPARAPPPANSFQKIGNLRNLTA